MKKFRVHSHQDSQQDDGEEEFSTKISPDDPALKLIQKKGQFVRPIVLRVACGTAVCLLGILGANAFGLFDTVSTSKSKQSVAKRLSHAPSRDLDADERDQLFYEFDSNEEFVAVAVKGAEEETLAGHWLGEQPTIVSQTEQNSYAAKRQQQFDERMAETARRELEKVGNSSMYVTIGNGEASEHAPAVHSALSQATGTVGATTEAPRRQGFSHQGSFSLSQRLRTPRTPHIVQTMSFINAALDTAVNSDIPGKIKARVTETVWDSLTLSTVLIPQGSTVMGSYDSHVIFGEMRVLACWDRLQLPNGKTIALECMPAADRQGMSGLTHDVSEHWGRLIKATGLATVLSLSVQAVSGARGTVTDSPNLLQQAGVNAARQFNAGGQAIVRRGLNLKPTITVPMGFPVTVVVTRDIELEPYRGRGL